MGAMQTKSPLERRNTIVRRSQRRSLHNLKPKIDNIYKEIKKFKGVDEDERYSKLKQQIETLKIELNRKNKDLQPQIRNQFENVYKRICEAEMALEAKLEENQEKDNKKQQQKKVEDAVPVIPVNGISDVTSNVSQLETVVEVHEDQPSTERRKSVQLKLIKVASQEELDKINKKVTSPIDKRKSILKVGIPVMPGAVLTELSQTNRMTRFLDDSPEPVQNPNDQIQSIIDKLVKIELDISEFVGKKDGVKYNKIKDILDKYSVQLDTIQATDDFNLEQMERCRNYIFSCFSFLNDKATDYTRQDTIGDDDVFENNNVKQEAKVAHNFKLQQLLKNTPV